MRLRGSGFLQFTYFDHTGSLQSPPHASDTGPGRPDAALEARAIRHALGVN
jgi:hypothetical protein